MPAFQEHGWSHYDRLGAFLHWDLKLQYLIFLLLPLGFLPLLAWRSALAALPLIALNLSVAYISQFSMKYHYDDFSSVFLLVSTVHGFKKILDLSAVQQNLRFVPTIVMIIVSILSSPQDRNCYAMSRKCLPTRIGTYTNAN